MDCKSPAGPLLEKWNKNCRAAVIGETAVDSASTTVPDIK